MKVLFSSYHNPNFGSMTESIEKTIINMGFQLEIFDWYRFLIPGRLRERIPLLHRLDINRINRTLIRKVQNFQPDILIVAGGVTIYPETIKEIKNLTNVVAANWIADYPRNFDRQLKACIHYDHFFVSGNDALAKYRETGRKNGHWLPFACDPEIHKPVDISNEDKRKYGCDICFVGSNYPERVSILEKLSGLDLGIWGIGWDRLPVDSPLRQHVRGGVLQPEEWTKVYNCSKIVLNILSIKLDGAIELADPKYGHIANTKVFEILGCGAFQLVETKSDVVKLFKPGKHLVCYEDSGELVQQIEYYLNNPVDRELIADNGRRIAHEEHTYQHRLEEMFSYINQDPIHC